MKGRIVVILCLCLLLLSSCAPSGNTSTQATPDEDQPGNNLPSPTAEALPGLLQTEQLLLMTPPQVSDPVSLAQRLKSQAAGTFARVSDTTQPARQVGQEESFWIENQDTETYSQIHAHLVALTSHVLMYVEDNQPFNQQAFQSSADTFDQQIYPGGLATSGGTGGNAPIAILNTVGLGTNVGGFFSAQDEYSTSIYPYSNQRDMLYMNLDGEIPGSADYNSALANEFQQLVDWHEHPLTFNWMNGGLAILAQHLNNYSADGVDRAFLKAPDIQLTNWPDVPNLQAAHAGASYLFLDYFAEHYGGYSVLKELLQDPAVPPKNFDDVLAKHNYPDRFPDVLNKWLVANFVADPSIDVGEYGYPTIHLPAVTPQHVITTYPLSESGQVSQYAAEYYDLHPHSGKASTLAVHLNGSPTVRLVGNDPLDSAGEWWGNRANNMDNTLTRSVDLSSLQGQHATLEFSTWFDLAQDRDYAYAEVSTNNGVSWNTLKGKFSTSSNPNGLSWGNGYTGVSGGGSTPAWVQESIDLTPYAGKKILLRFEEVTDNAVALQGFAIDQVRIPEINYQDNAPGSGWTSQGFVHTNNILPEHYLVQAIVYTGSTFTVQAMNVDLASAQGTLTLPHFGEKVTRVVLIVSAYALDTTLQAHYQLTIHMT